MVQAPARPEIQTAWPVAKPSAAQVPDERVRLLVAIVMVPVNDSFFGSATWTVGATLFPVAMAGPLSSMTLLVPWPWYGFTYGTDGALTPVALAKPRICRVPVSPLICTYWPMA